MAKGFKTGGRTKGTPNRASLDVKALAQEHGPKAIKNLAWLADHAESEQARVAANNAILDRAYGKPHQTQEIAITDARAESLSDDELAGIIASRRSNGAATPPDDPKVVH